MPAGRRAEVLLGLVQIAALEMRPAEAVEVRAVVGLGLERLAHQLRWPRPAVAAHRQQVAEIVRARWRWWARPTSTWRSAFSASGLRPASGTCRRADRACSCPWGTRAPRLPSPTGRRRGSPPSNSARARSRGKRASSGCCRCASAAADAAAAQVLGAEERGDAPRLQLAAHRLHCRAPSCTTPPPRGTGPPVPGTARAAAATRGSSSTMTSSVVDGRRQVLGRRVRLRQQQARLHRARVLSDDHAVERLAPPCPAGRCAGRADRA